MVKHSRIPGIRVTVTVAGEVIRTVPTAECTLKLFTYLDATEVVGAVTIPIRRVAVQRPSDAMHSLWSQIVSMNERSRKAVDVTVVVSVTA